MSRKGEQRAWRAFRTPIVRVVGCVDQSARLIEAAFARKRRLIATRPEAPIPFGRMLELSFAITLEHVVKQGEPRMSTVRYVYTLSRPGAPPTQVFGWHWHPESQRSGVLTPHLHLPKGVPYASTHVPTGRICLEDIVLFGFDQLEVEPTTQNGADIVRESRSTHAQHRGWS